MLYTSDLILIKEKPNLMVGFSLLSMASSWWLPLLVCCLVLVVGQTSNADLDGSIRGAPIPQIFIIAGTQKSGTTALASYLAKHANITFSDTKELHFFDKLRIYKTGIEKYLSHFAVTPQTAFIGEATPSYLASRSACKRIATHFSDVKMIVLLREPVDRAYSEYQMKVRRVAEQTHFLELVQQHVQEAYDCIAQHPDKYKSIESCLPEPIRSHGRMGKLKKALRLAHEALGNWTHVLQLCFTEYAYSDGVSCQLAVDGSQQCAGPQLVFHPQRCWEHYKDGHEQVASLADAFIGEIEAFKNCSGYNASELAGMGSVAEQLQWLDRAIDQCVQVKSGISLHYFYRSMYAVQLHHCYKSIPAEQFLVIGSRQLREQPHLVTAQVLAFLGMDPSTAWMPEAQEELDNMTRTSFAGMLLSLSCSRLLITMHDSVRQDHGLAAQFRLRASAS